MKIPMVTRQSASQSDCAHPRVGLGVLLQQTPLWESAGNQAKVTRAQNIAELEVISVAVGEVITGRALFVHLLRAQLYTSPIGQHTSTEHEAGVGSH